MVVDEEFGRINKDVERIIKAESINLMTLPDKVLSTWDEVEQNLRDQLDLKIRLESDRLKQTFARYKNLMEKTIL